MATVATPRANGRAPRVLDAVSRPTGLAAALLAFHAKAPKLTASEPGQVGSRSYLYVSLDALLDVVEPLLLEHDLLWTAKVVLEDGQPAALYRMEHVPSGEHDEWTGPLPCTEPGPQNLGSAITYMRRYTLQAYLNLAPGEDDDGGRASQGRTRFEPGSSQAIANQGGASERSDPMVNTGSPQPTAAPPKPSERAATAKQQVMLKARAKAAKLSDGALANLILKAEDEEPRTWRTEEHASQTLARLIDRLPARLVTQVKEAIG